MIIGSNSRPIPSRPTGKCLLKQIAQTLLGLDCERVMLGHGLEHGLVDPVNLIDDKVLH